MTKKKSNVKALALAVTCAILAGGYSSLNPVYAADAQKLYTNSNTVTTDAGTGTPGNTELDYISIGGVTIGKDSASSSGRIDATNAKITNNLTVNNTLRIDNALNVGDKISLSASDGKLIVGAARINGNNTVTGILRAGELKGLDITDPSNSTIVTGQSDLKVNGATFKDGGAITASSLALSDGTGTIDVATAISAKASQADVDTLKDKTTNISYTAGTGTTVDGVIINDGVVNGVKSINGSNDAFNVDKDGNLTAKGKIQGGDIAATGGVTANNYIKAGNSVEAGLDNTTHKYAVKLSSSGINTDTISEMTTNSGVTVAGVKMQAGKLVGTNNNEISVDQLAADSANVAGIARSGDDLTGYATTIEGKVKVKTDGTVTGVSSLNGKVTFEDDGTVYINKDADKNQIKIDTDGKVIIGKTSSAYDEDGFYAGGHSYDEAKAAIKDDGSLKAADGKFVVDGTSGKATFGDAANKVEIENGAITASGNATVGGNLTVTGTSTFTGETTFSGGIKTDKISEATTGAGVTVNGNKITTDNKFNDVTLKDGNVEATDITATGALKGKTLGIGGTANDRFTVANDGLATFGDSSGNKSTIAGKTATFGVGTGDQTVITGGTITAKSLNVASFGADTITANDTLKVGTNVSLNKDGNLVLGTNTLTDAQLGNINATIQPDQAIAAKSGSIGGVKFSTTGEMTDVKNITAEKGTIGQVGLEGGKVTADKGTIGGVNFTGGGVITGVNELTATTIKDGAGTIITGGNIESKTAKIGAISIENEKIEGSSANGLSIEGVKIKDGDISDVNSIKATSATIGNNTLDNNGLTVATGSKVQVGTNTIITDGQVQVSTNTKLAAQSLVLNASNSWTHADGLKADKATVNGIVLGADGKQGKATFTDADGKVTTIDGNTINTGTITADKLLIDKISLGKDGSENITIDKDGNVSTKGDITVTGTDSDTTVIDGAKASFGKNADNQTIIDKGNITATAHDATTHQQSKLTHDKEGFTVAGKDANNKDSSFNFSTKTGIGTFTGQDSTTTTINGSKLTSSKSATDTGVLDGSNLTLDDGTNKTELSAGGAKFTKDGKTTEISGDTITTGKLITDELVITGQGDAAGDGGSIAFGGNGTIKSDIKVGSKNTKFTTDIDGVTTKVTDGAKTTINEVNATGNKNTVTVSDSSGAITDSSERRQTATAITDKVGNTTVETKDGSFSVKDATTGKGMDINTSTGETTFTGEAGEKGGTTTTINGGNITTDTLNVERINLGGELLDSNGSPAGGNLSMDAKGNFSAAGGKFKVDGASGAMTNTVGNTTFKTDADGVTSTVGVGDNNSSFTQNQTSIAGVVTNGTVKMKQELTSEGLSITNGEENPKNITKISDTDVSITNPKGSSSRINLSDLGSLGDLNEEITSREEYTSNKTAVGAINAEAGIRREEVARLDGRINDVNDRVNKVGAMAAAIASLKSIGYDPQAPSEFSIGLGQYKGETGVAMGFFHYPNKNFMINVSLSTAGGETMGGIGATWRFGHKSPQKLLDEQREAQAKKELAAAEKYKVAAQLAKEAQERAEYAAKLARQAQVSADNAKAAADATQAKHF